MVTFNISAIEASIRANVFTELIVLNFFFLFHFLLFRYVAYFIVVHV